MTATPTAGRCTLISFVLLLGIARAEPLTIAVASNFLPPAREIATRFESGDPAAVRITAGSTGKLYAQIVNGAPFDVLLAADAERPRLLEASGAGVAGTRFTYATGGLVLWSNDPRLAGIDCRSALADLGTRKLAIANPQTAPYGAAAEQFLRSAALWDRVQTGLVYGENIAQALQFVVSGNASLGLIAAAQATDGRVPAPSCHWEVPASMHAPIEQQAILLQHGAQAGPEAARFLEYLRGPEALEVIRAHGYSLPQ
jgi:molybdate transport system substrate-binding protein